MIAHIRRQRNLYTLTSHKLEIQEGLLARTTRNVPLSKVQDVTVAASFVNRLLGLGDIRIDNASESLGQIVVHGVRDPKRYADLVRRESALELGVRRRCQRPAGFTYDVSKQHRSGTRRGVPARRAGGGGGAW